jgi:hypothetical protein
MGETLRELVVRLADEPTLANQEAFYRALLAAQVAVPLKSLPAGVRPGLNVAADGQLGVARTQGPDGSVMLLVYTDQQAALESSGARTGFTLQGRVVLEVAAANQAGVIVTTGYGPTASWGRCSARGCRGGAVPGRDPPLTGRCA